MNPTHDIMHAKTLFLERGFNMKIKFTNLPQELEKPLCEIAPLLPFSLENDGTAVAVQKNEVGPKIIVSEGQVTIEYHKIPEFFRMLTMLPKHISANGRYEEVPAYEDLCLMSDCSRNAVFSMDGAKRMIRYLALMGFTSFMLYTEDTYEVPEYPFFGYLRGRFSQDELKELDAYSAAFGIEMIPCMQVLAHLEAALRWPAFKEIIDTGNILLVGEEETYKFIEAMIKSCRECFRTDRIHIGMDEAHMMGLGKYLDQNGFRNRNEIFLEHLDRVVKICEKYGFKPMIWSDMFFRIQFHKYYVDEGEIEQNVIDMVPENLTLVYWDYYTKDEKTFRHMVDCHKQFHNPTYFAGGAWKWGCMSPRNYYSLMVNDLHLKVAKEEKIPMVIATAWGDNGGEASNFSIIPTLQQYAEYCYANGEDRAWVKSRFMETFGVDFDDFLLIDRPNLLSDVDRTQRRDINSKSLLYNDPLGGWIDCRVKPEFADEYAEMASELAKVPENNFSYVIRSSEALCRVLALKATLSLDIRNAYHAKDTEALKSIAAKRIPATIDALNNYIVAARDEWYHDNKTFGFDVIELRLGGLKERLNTTKLTLERYINGDLDKIEQLEETLLQVHVESGGRNWTGISTAVRNY